MDMEAAPLLKRAPEDDFAVELYRRLIEVELSKWEDQVDVSLGDYDEPDGSWDLYITKAQEEFDMMTFLDMPTVRGKVYLAERAYPATERFRVVVIWELGSQANDARYTPILDWNAPNPAGPWN